MLSKVSVFDHKSRCEVVLTYSDSTCTQTVSLLDPQTGEGVGPLDFLDNEGKAICEGTAKLSVQTVEKWFCLGDVRNRVGMWIQGKRISPRTPAD